MTKNLKRIEGDIFGVASRLLEIDRAYELYFNGDKNRYEVYSRHGDNLVLEVVSPFEGLDARLVAHTRKTRREFARENIARMEEENRHIEEHNNENVVDNARQRAKLLLEKLKKENSL